ncbi:hypothetical protein B296_00003489 [Ensete ventricosum]|uniref:Uncharacterized protein n=1 Tax=Ensete ventricosum TaxID=4639 RepID=A0A427B9A2_ENSVE|nr:hypothetical protein B296_00003489 [Ensete ventricosum]
MDYRLKQYQEKLNALKSNGGPEAVAKAEERAVELQEELERTRLEEDGSVTYESGYQVALGRFYARYPDAEVEEDPFTIHPEDDLVPM